MWNVRNLPPPPNLTYKSTTLDVATLKKACLRAVSILKDQKQLHSEAALLSRFLYNTKTKFRSDKGFNFLGKVNRGLLQYLSMNLHATYVNFCECLPDSSEPDQTVPSCQMLQYLLIRTQAFACLWCYIISQCQEAARLLQGRVGLGHNWWSAIVALAITSRIWTMGKYLIVCASDWYSQLKPFLKILKVKGLPWLPENYIFPDDLQQWLKMNLQENDIASRKCRVKPKNVSISIDKLFAAACGNDDDSDEGGDTIELIENGSLTNDIHGSNQQLQEDDDNSTRNMNIISQMKLVTHFTDDIGESVTRESVEMCQVDIDNAKSALKSGIHNLLSQANQTSGEHNINNYMSDELSNNTNYIGNNKNIDILLNHETYPAEIPTKSKKQKCVSRTKFHSVTGNHSTSLTVKDQIAKLKTHFELMSFLEREEHLRQQKNKLCITHKLDMLQWNMLKNVISSYVAKLVKSHLSKNEAKYKIFIRKARKEIRVRLG